MKRMFAVLMVLVLCGMAAAASLDANVASQSIQFVMFDTAGAPKTALTYGDFTVTYVIDGAAAVDVTEATLAAVDSAYSSGGIIEVEATKCPGLYRFDVPIGAVTVTKTAVQKRVSFTFKYSGCNNTYAYYDLTPNVNTTLAGGTTMTAAPTNFSSLSIDESGQVKVGTVASGVIAADLWNSLWTSYTTENSFGWMIKRIYDKVLSLRK